ncbi:MAG: response regulator [Chloroflexota bacterium]|nr:response regulator [Chloroflexota bacterium]
MPRRPSSCSPWPVHGWRQSASQSASQSVRKRGRPVAAPDAPRVLVVEDNDLNYQLVAFVLSRLGLSVLRAADAEAALDLATSERPDLIYMDIQLPGTDGLEVTRRLKASSATCNVPVIALTAFAMVGDEEKALAAGCDGYLTKPVSPQQLRAVTQRFLRQSNAGEDHSG